jgi:hypothetical protein
MADIGRATRAALGVVLAVVCFLAMVAFLSTLRGTSEPKTLRQGPRDAPMYDRLVDRVRHGEDFYAASGEELRRGGYPIGSVVGWRTPTLYVALAHATKTQAVRLLRVLAMLSVLLAISSTRGTTVRTLTGLLVAGAMIGVWAPTAVGFGEAWAATLIACSLGCYSSGWRIPAILLALAALFVRELTAPYIAVCASLSLARRERREIALWIVGGVSFVAFYLSHVAAVHAHQLPTDNLLVGPWGDGGGFRFLLTTLRLNFWLVLWPRWALGLLVLAGVAIVPMVKTSRAEVWGAAALYTGLFLIVGDRTRDYWGLLTAPIWAFAWGSLGALADSRLKTSTEVQMAPTAR